MNAGEPRSESAIGDRQDVTSHSEGTGIEGTGPTDLDALLGDHPIDPHFKRQLEQLDHLDLSHLEEESTRESTPTTPSSQSGLVRNPLAPGEHPPSSSTSRSGTPTQSVSRPQLSALSSIASPQRSQSLSDLQNSTAAAADLTTDLTADLTSSHPLRSPSRADSSHTTPQPIKSPITESTTAQTSRQGSLAPTDEEVPHPLSQNDGSRLTPSNVQLDHPEASPSSAKSTSTTTVGANAVDIDSDLQRNGSPANQESLPPTSAMDDDSANRVSAYARLDFDSFTFYVQTLQVVLGRRSEHGGPSADVDVHLGPAKAISRRHAKIFYNFATQRFELTVIGRNGAFVGDVFVETGSTVPLRDSTKVQIGQIAFNFVLPIQGKHDGSGDSDGENPVDEELEVEDTGEEISKSDNEDSSKTKEKPAGLGSEKGRGGKLKQRAQSAKPKQAESAGPDRDLGETASDNNIGGNNNSNNSSLHHDNNSGKLGAHDNSLPVATMTQKPEHEKSTTNSPGNLASSLGGPSGTAHGVEGTPNIENSMGLSSTSTSTAGPARSKPRQSSFLKRSDENNLFAHVPPDQLAAVNAQVDAAIAGLPDIPGFDTPAMGPSGTNAAPSPSAGANQALPQRVGGDAGNLNQLLGLQTQLGLQQPNANLSNLNTLMGLGGNLGGFQGLQQGAAQPAAGLQSLQQLQALQSLQGLDGLQGLQGLSGLQGFQGLQPAAGLGLLQQLQALQRTKTAATQGAAQPQTRQKRKPKREYRPEEIPEQYRTKPAHSYSHLITAALRDRLSSMPDGTQGGLSLGDIYEAIMDLFPYYRYCPPGWQNSVRHNLSSSKSFRKVSKEGKGWLWGLDEEYLAEKEKQRQRALQRQQQQALAQQQAMAEQHAREQAREQARQAQLQRDREREMEQRRFLAERAARAAQVGVPLHQLSATLGTTNIHALGGETGGSLSSGYGGGIGSGSSGSTRSASINPSSASGDSGASKPTVLPAETVKLLAGLQHHVQEELAKEGQPPLNPQLLSNALAVVIAQTAKQAGGLQSLGTVLQQPGAVQKLLNQAMQLLRSTQRVPAPVAKPPGPPQTPSTSSIVPPSIATATSALPQSSNIDSFRQNSTASAAHSAAPSVLPGNQPSRSSEGVPVSAPGSTGTPSYGTEIPVAKSESAEEPSSLAPSSAQIQAQPHIQSSSKTEERSHSEPATKQAQPHVQQPSRPEVKIADQPAQPKLEPETAPEGKTDEGVSSEVKPEVSQPSNKASDNAGDKASEPQDSMDKASEANQPSKPVESKPKTPSAEPAKKQQPSLEKISEILAKAEAIPNPTAEVKGMIDKLKAHKRQLELKRSADNSSSVQAPAPKRPAVE